MIETTYGTGLIKIQVKAADRTAVLADGQSIAFVIDRRDLDYWLGEIEPVMIVLYDAQQDCAYCMCVQAYFQERFGTHFTLVGKSITVHFNVQDRLNSDGVRRFAQYKSNLGAQRPEIVYYVL